MNIVSELTLLTLYCYTLTEKMAKKDQNFSFSKLKNWLKKTKNRVNYRLGHDNTIVLSYQKAPSDLI